MLGRVLIKYLIKKNTHISQYLKILLKRMKRIETRKIIWLDELNDEKILTFKHSRNDLNFQPITLNSNQKNDFIAQIPEVNLYKFSNVTINTNSSNLITTSNAIFERVKGANIAYCNYSTGIIKWHNHENMILRYNKKKESISHAIFLGGNGVFNYYHWLLEVSPKILLLDSDLLNKYNIKHLILDKRVKKISSFQKILSLYFKEKDLNLEIIYSDHNIDLHVSELFYINNENNIVFNSKEILSSPDFSILSKSLISEIREIILKSNTCLSKDFPKRIFLARKENAARSYNQNEILEYFISKDFTPLYLEDYDFYEQVTIFNNAEFIAGPSGAAWSNIIFCNSHCKAISWLPKHLSEFSIFSTLAKINDCDMRFILTLSDNPNDIHSSYYLDIEDIKNLYENFIS
ncbi:glycosyltransferase family 61 protein [Acinetobacter beijerinckii]|uniref:Glycosyltransferase 61 catalytic domain-containing protein n=1 Tax=Acinetobacter beijerinckii CIP 110307 TaxID=1217648 RepID=N9E5V9_9GAMM|nr:glycosyltransferase family 61 protein [Acinetobacter beijerinckii]ENW05517.1 hypothetical protein F933_02418 [Acinetobacter beijerinckii CIP 110307]